LVQRLRILVAPIVNDQDTAAAHAALITREYGIPDVVAAGSATTSITTESPSPSAAAVAS